MEENKNTEKTYQNPYTLVISESDTDKSNEMIKSEILQADCSMVITDFSDRLYKECREILENKGYKVKCLNLSEPEKSNHYNPFNYFHSDEDIKIFVKSLITDKVHYEKWEKYESALLCALIAYLYHYRPVEEHTLSMVDTLIRSTSLSDVDAFKLWPLDEIFIDLFKKDSECFAVTQYSTYRIGAFTEFPMSLIEPILISSVVRLQAFELDAINSLTATDDIDLNSLPQTKTAIFIVTEEEDKTFAFLGSLLITQALQLLRTKSCDNQISHTNSMHVKFLLEDFQDLAIPSELVDVCGIERK